MKIFWIEKDKVTESLTYLKKMRTQKDQTIEKLKQIIGKFETERHGFIEDQKKLIWLFGMGVIDSNGDLSLFLSEREKKDKWARTIKIILWKL